MKRVLTGFLAAALLVVGAPGTVAANDPVTVTVTSATLVARGAAVQVTIAVVCDPLNDETILSLSGGSVSVYQAVSKKLWTSGGNMLPSSWPPPGLTCDGSGYVNQLTALILPSSSAGPTVPFRNGVALVTAYVYLSDSFANQVSASTQVTVRLK